MSDSSFDSLNNVPPPPFITPEQRLREGFTNRMALIEVLLIFTFVVYGLIVLFGMVRPRFRTSWLRTISGAGVVPLAGYLLSFVPGLMSPSSKISNDIFALWMAFLVYLAATSNAFSCYSLGDNEDRKKRLLADYIFPWGVIVAAVYKNLAVPQILGPVVLVFILVLVKMKERQVALSAATLSTSGLSRSAEVIHKFLTDWKHLHGESSDNGKDLLVDVRDLKVTLDKIKRKWRSKKQEKEKMDKLISSENQPITMDEVRRHIKDAVKSGNAEVDERLKRTCFSFSLFWLLLAKTAGYEKFDVNAPFVSRQILDLKDDDIFRLIQKEIEFLYDYLFTNHYAVYIRGMQRKFNHLLVILFFIWIIVPVFTEYRPQDQEMAYLVVAGHMVDTGVTRFVILAILSVEFGHLAIFLTSDWAKAIYVCRCIQKHMMEQPSLSTAKRISLSLLRIWTKVVCWLPRPGSVGRKTISQYSLHPAGRSVPCMLWLQPSLDGFIRLPKMGQSGYKKVEISLAIRRAVIELIKKRTNDDRKLSNGEFSLKQGRIDQSLIRAYVYQLGTQARVILVWHIATSALETRYNVDAPSTGMKDSAYDNFQVANTFSRYCAYLVADAPKLLPDQLYTAECIFDDVIKEIEQDKSLNGPAAFNWVDRDEEKNSEEATLDIGRRLRDEIDGLLNRGKLDIDELWKILAEFWTEMLLFLALTDKEYAFETHAQYLCTGGEFITSLWALATHVGLSKSATLWEYKQQPSAARNFA